MNVSRLKIKPMSQKTRYFKTQITESMEEVLAQQVSKLDMLRTEFYTMICQAFMEQCDPSSLELFEPPDEDIHTVAARLDASFVDEFEQFCRAQFPGERSMFKMRFNVIKWWMDREGHEYEYNIPLLVQYKAEKQDRFAAQLPERSIEALNEAKDSREWNRQRLSCAAALDFIKQTEANPTFWTPGVEVTRDDGPTKSFGSTLPRSVAAQLSQIARAKNTDVDKIYEAMFLLWLKRHGSGVYSEQETAQTTNIYLPSLLWQGIRVLLPLGVFKDEQQFVEQALNYFFAQRAAQGYTSFKYQPLNIESDWENLYINLNPNQHQLLTVYTHMEKESPETILYNAVQIYFEYVKNQHAQRLKEILGF